MRFLVDAQLPPALAKWISDKGSSASAVRDQGLRNSDDGSIANFATSSDWIVVTKDEDIVERALGRKDGARVVWLRIGNSTNRALFAWLEPLWPEVIRQLREGQRVIEVRRD
jgi:predicted nuclease of predicted toxin-antitoxin system